MSYILVIVLSLISNIINFKLEIIESNIAHIKNGREPNASASIIPVIPLAQFFYVGIAWLLNQYIEYGYIIVVLFICIVVVLNLHTIQRKSKEYTELINEHGT